MKVNHQVTAISCGFVFPQRIFSSLSPAPFLTKRLRIQQRGSLKAKHRLQEHGFAPGEGLTHRSVCPTSVLNLHGASVSRSITLGPTICPGRSSNTLLCRAGTGKCACVDETGSSTGVPRGTRSNWTFNRCYEAGSARCQ